MHFPSAPKKCIAGVETPSCDKVDITRAKSPTLRAILSVSSGMSLTGAPLIALPNQLVTLQNTALLFTGLWLQEFIVHLRHDWRLVKRPHAGRPVVARLAKWTYLACRIFCLIHCVCVSVITFPVFSDCHVLIKVLTASGFFDIICASTLLSIRVAAVWSWNKRVVSLLVVVALVTLALSIYLMVKIDSSYDPATLACVLTGLEDALAPSVAMLAGDCIILSLLLVGLQRNWGDARKFRVWHILWTQGLIYLLFAAVFEIPFVALLALDINPILNAMFVTPESVVLAVCATRMFRSLNASVGGQNGQSEMFTNGVPRDGISTWCVNEIPLVPLRDEWDQRR
ncbi:unnamed protein product [Peniophora sp. CBMAI 1063]|nr:unnamed protein product [Peniophora sp. CBMAI 1063]